jgi:hypothetical protein
VLRRLVPDELCCFADRQTGEVFEFQLLRADRLLPAFT